MRKAHYESYTYSDPGEHRNDDRSCLHILKEKQGGSSFLLGIFDGVGSSLGYAASEFIENEIETWLAENPKTLESGSYEDIDELLNTFHDLVLDIHEGLKKHNSELAISAQSTFTLSLIGKKQYLTCHVGDSRAYLIQNGTVTQITKDQTLGQRDRDKGIPDLEDKMEQKVKDSMLLQAMGYGRVIPSYYSGPLEDDFIFFSCSDGYSNLISDEEFKEKLEEGDFIYEGMKDIGLLARERGEQDNITAVAVKREIL